MAKHSLPSKSTLFIKRLFDVVSSGAVILCLSWFFVLFTPIVAVVMKGNPFFVQKRVGKGEKIFSLVKYRTMTNAKDKEGNLLPDADRLSKFGDVMRRFSIDELPELFNILFGQMSVVGPRPLQAVYLPFYTDEQRLRNSVRPGLTGYAQIHGRNTTPWDVRLRYDNEYVQNMTPFGDLKIIFDTVLKVVKGDDVAVMGEQRCVGNLYDEVDKSNLVWREIGSAFTFGDVQTIAEANGDGAKDRGLRIDCDKPNRFEFESGRSAIIAVVQKTGAKKAFLPAYTCESVIKPFVDAGIEIEFYQCDKQCNPDKDLVKAVKGETQKTIVYLQSYFGGYNLNGTKKKLARIKQAVVVEDVTHALLSTCKFVGADYYVASVRKWGGFGEGGIVLSSESFDAPQNDEAIIDALQSAAALQREYYANARFDTAQKNGANKPDANKPDVNKDYAKKADADASKNAVNDEADKTEIDLAALADAKERFRALLRKAEAEFDDIDAAKSIAPQSRELIACADFESVRLARRNNYIALDNMLKEFASIVPVIAHLKDNQVPLYYAFYFPQRERLQRFLAERDIYCPVIWPKCAFVDGKCSKEVDWIYDNVLCFPIDQRYGIDDMKRIFYAVEEFCNDDALS